MKDSGQGTFNTGLLLDLVTEKLTVCARPESYVRGQVCLHHQLYKFIVLLSIVGACWVEKDLYVWPRTVVKICNFV